MIHQKVINIVNIYAPNTRAPKYTKQILTELKREINSNTIKAGNFYTPLSTLIDHSDSKTGNLGSVKFDQHCNYFP